MTYYPYRKEGQAAQTPNNFEPFLNLPKDKLVQIPSDKDSSNRFRFMPPWSEEGAFAKGTVLHFGVGIKSQTIVCPNTVQDGTCEFCAVHARIKGDERYALDVNGIKGRGGIRPTQRFFSNVVNVMQPASGVQVYAYGITNFLTIKKYQDSGEYGDLFDPQYGRDLIIDRTCRPKIQDTIMVTGSPGLIQNADWLDQIIDLDAMLPPVNLETVGNLFRSHPWKIYEPGVRVQVPRSVPVPPQMNPVLAPEIPTSTAAPEPTSNSATNFEKMKAMEAAHGADGSAVTESAKITADAKVDDLRARIMAKMQGKKA